MSTQIISIGYEKRTIEELVFLLNQYGVDKLLDVRELPLSRKKGFSKTALSQRLKNEGIEYHHLRKAGNPYRKVNTDVKKCLALYEGYLQNHNEVIDLVVSEFSNSTVAVLCFERDHNACHRSILIENINTENNPIELIKVG